MSYTPPYQITDRILSLVAHISERVGTITERARTDAKPHLRRNNRIRSVHASLAIEANSLSLDDVRDIIDGRTVVGSRKEIQEVQNAYAAYEQIGSFDVYRVADLKRLHGVMTQGTVAESGTFRRGEEGVFSGDRCIFMAPPARLVPAQMDALFDWMQRSRETVHPLILSAVFHYEFVFIHPFADGNGRMARLWHTAILAAWQPIFASIPIESRIEQCQDAYYAAIAQCHVDGSSTAFIEFMLTQIDAVLDEAAAEREPVLSGCVQRLLDAMTPGVPYAAAELLDLLGLKSRETLRRHYLNPAMADGYVAMTVPGQPNNRNQKYVKR